MTAYDRVAAASGIYGLVRLDGAPVDALDADALGMPRAEPACCHAYAIDSSSPDSVHRASDSEGLTILAGHIEERAALAARLQLPATTPLALLARAALLRFGKEMPGAAIGEWSLLHWQRAGRQLTLTMSAARRDRLLYAALGSRVALAPDLFRLSRLRWVGTSLDEAGLLFALGRGALRDGICSRTMLAKVSQLEPGASVTFTMDAIHQAQAEMFKPQPPWSGSFEDAMQETDSVIRTVLRQRLERTATPAILLSGGLDSSALAALSTQERRSGQPLLLFTSVAPDGSGLGDESAFADAVADELGLKSEHVFPARQANIYRPPDHILGGASGPPLPTRHCLAETFQTLGRERSTTMLLDGTWGELTLTGYAPSLGLRQRLRKAAGLVRYSKGRNAVAGAFHVRLSPRCLAVLPEAVRSRLARGSPEIPVPHPGEPWGYHPGAIKAMRHANEFYGGAIRVEYPYRDLRLLRLFAGFPAVFLNRGGADRAPARHIIAGWLPDEIRLRTSGRPASPDHLHRMQAQAPEARARIATFRKAEIDEWLDLHWLDSALGRVAAKGPEDYHDANAVQLTAITAEFLTWWRERC